jgi:integrase
MRRYGDTIRLHIVPELGAVPLMRLTPERLQRLYAAKLAAGLSTTTVRGLAFLLHRALDQAVQWRKLARNPCDGTQPPRKNRPEMTTWTPDQARTFLAATVDDDLHALWRLALLTGLRRGELLALQWDAVDLDAGRLSVRRSLTFDRDRQWTIGEPKTAAGRRSVALPASCVAALKRHKAQQAARRLKMGDVWQATGLVFERGDGTLLHPNSVLGIFGRLTTAAGLPHIRFHDLRHTAACLALTNGVHAKVVSEMLGHSTIGMTMDLYSHVSADMQRDAADRMDRLASGL